ncbi:YqzL family protein [Paenibacillus apiarius]|uniref:YqzL family protein n=1 Tax=Paenibacillus apiarius TaxID=46240 RepID=A0ABT4DL63_9BACL|nr:YqzL family protein [Paenibacillus apiarius]MBN3525918.1 YqzL family protein [Paenibacillus apiarius]MCY9513543.1 YqzL family protein [Paenibacillus apiarius]MCY9518094.1 YqzL family protein [Paenibacillus apiarius]MCY9551505.1 YqzL family protein [Paenibacillus apiarius]MCY9558659.1 YqzL family protein [Paenibacillus apiarius]
MRDFSWNVFAMTGDVDAYLLYKQAGMVTEVEETAAEIGTGMSAEQSAE